MTLALTDGSTAKKAATGPNPQNRYGSTAQVNKQTGQIVPGQNNAGGVPGGGNPGVTSPGPSAPPAPPATTPQPPTAPTAPAASPPIYDYTTDPILQQINAQQGMVIAQAQSAALAQQKAALIAYGDPNLAMSVLGDKLTADAAAGNTGSTLATLAAQNATNIRGTNETENKSNLFYSSDRGYQLGLGQQAYLQNQAGAASALQSSLGGISTQLLASEQAAWNAEAQAQSDAYNRALSHPVGIPSQAPTPIPGSSTPSSPGGSDSGNPGSGNTGNGVANIAYAASPIGQQMVKAVQAHPASAGSSGAAQSLLAAALGKNVPNFQGARNAI